MNDREIYIGEDDLVTINTKCGDKSYRISMTNMYIHVYEIFENKDDEFVSEIRLGCTTPRIMTMNL